MTEKGDERDQIEVKTTTRKRRSSKGLRKQTEELKQRAAELEAERDKFEDLWLRARAELENYRKRMDRELSEQERRVAERLLLGVLEIKDNLEKALESVVPPCEEEEVKQHQESLREGILLIDKQMASFLAREGVSAIEAVGTGFDPQFHEAVMQVDAEEHQSDTVVSELQTGYLLGDRLLRPARVAVAK